MDQQLVECSNGEMHHVINHGILKKFKLDLMVKLFQVKLGAQAFSRPCLFLDEIISYTCGFLIGLEWFFL